jgi:hypothetical protein
MQKQDIAKRDGFSGWLDFHAFVAARAAGRAAWAVCAPPNNPGVYIFATVPLPRSRGISDIFYIGKADNLRNRIGKHLYRVARSAQSPEYGWVGSERSPEQGVATLVEQAQPIELGWIVTPTIEDALRTEHELLGAYRDEHDELPPNNRIGGTTR